MERSGAAQGLSEVCHSLGNEKLRIVLKTTLAWSSNKSAAAREGFYFIFEDLLQ